MRLAMPCISTSFPHFFHNCHRPVTAHSETADVNRSLAGKMWKDTPKRTTFHDAAIHGSKMQLEIAENLRNI